MSNPFDQFDAPAGQANPFDQFDTSTEPKSALGRGAEVAKNYLLTGASMAGQGSMGVIAGAADTLSAPVAKTRAMLAGGAALVDRLLPGAPNQTLQEFAQDEAAAAEQKAQQNALDNQVARGLAALRDGARERVGALKEFDQAFNPELVRQQRATAAAEGFVDNLAAIKDNPMAFAGNLVQSLPAMAVGVGMGSAAARGLGAVGKVAGMSEAATAGMALRGAGAVGVLSEAQMSGSMAREGVRASILETPHQQLASGSPRYQELLRKGVDPALARETLANEVANAASIPASLATAFGSVLTNKLMGDTTAKLVAGQAVTAREAGKNVVKETLEEATQGVGEDTAQHLAMLQADTAHKLDIGGSLAQNAAAGFGMAAPGSAGGYASQRINQARGLNLDGTPKNVTNAPQAGTGAGAAPAAAQGAAQGQPQGADAAGAARAAAAATGATAGAGAAPVAPAGLGFDYASYPSYRRALESGGRADARNPNSSAYGADQFTRGTWLDVVARAKPAWAQGLSEADLLEQRANPERSAEMAAVLDQQSATALRRAGQPVNQHTLYAAHHFGASKGIEFARAAGDTLMDNILSPAQLDANRYLKGKTKAEAIAGWDARAAKAGATVQAATNNVAADAQPAPAQTENDSQSPGTDMAATATEQAQEALTQPRELTALDRATRLDAEAAQARARLATLGEQQFGPAFDAERAELSQRVADLDAEIGTLKRDWPAFLPGREASFTTETGARLQGRYALVDASQLVTSHDESLRKNPAYPVELQPRERDRAASEMQISGIVGRLDPARLGLSADAATGAPIVGADGLVESGNARTIALKRIYQAAGQKAEDYRSFLEQNAAEFGVDPEQVRGMQQPVLVRVRDTPVNRAEFARQANASTVAAMSPSEQARADAERIDAMDDLTPDDNGDFMGASNRGFVRRFMSRLPATEQAAMVDAGGMLSTAGYTRVRNAVLAKAYGNSPVLQRMTEALDDNSRNLSRALMMAAPEVAKMRSAIQAGARHDVDIVSDLVAAVEEMSRLKDDGVSVREALAQAGMFGDKYSPETRDFMEFLAENARRPRRIADFIKSYYEALDQAGDPNQGSLLGAAEPPAKGDLMQAARRATNEGETDAGSRGERAQQTAAGGQGDQLAGRQDRGQRENAQGREGLDRGDQEKAGRQEVDPAPDATKNVAVSAQPAPAQAESGAKIAPEQWVAFTPDTGTLGIPRADMPQIKAGDRSAFLQYLRAMGMDYAKDTVAADALKPTQAEFSVAKVDSYARRGFDSDRSVLVSRDGYVLDGHHQWMAHRVAGRDIPVIRIDATMRELLDAAGKFPAVQRSGGAQNVVSLQDRRAEAVADFKAAMADLAELATRHHRAALVPEKAPDLMPTLVKLFDAAIRIVGTDIRAASAWVRKQLRANEATRKLANQIEPATFRKAAEQALASMQQPAQGGLFDSVEQADAALQGDLFAAAPEPIPATARQRITAFSDLPAIETLASPQVLQEIKALSQQFPAPKAEIDPADKAEAAEALRPFMELAAQAREAFEATVTRLGEAFTGHLLPPGLKKIERAAEKLVLDGRTDGKYDGAGIKDLLRATVLVDSYDRAPDALQAIYAAFNVVRVKNRTGMKLEGDARFAGLDDDGITVAGYSDLLVNVRLPNGLTAEIQINTPEVLAAKEGAGHALFEISRVRSGTDGARRAIEMSNDLYAAARAARAAARVAARTNRASSELNPLSMGVPVISRNSPESDNLNQRPSGNLTKSSPPSDSMKKQPGGNLSGSFIASSDDALIVNDGAKTRQNDTAKRTDKGQRDDDKTTDLFAGDEGAGAQAVRAAGEGGRAAVDGAPAGGRGERGDRGRVDEPAYQAGRAEAAADGERGAPERDAGRSAGKRPGQSAGVPAGRDIPLKSGRNYRFTGDADLTYAGSWAKKAEANVAAVELLATLTKEQRQATPEEQATLAKFVGWGAGDLANNLFDERNVRLRENRVRNYDAAVKAIEAAGGSVELYRHGAASYSPAYSALPRDATGAPTGGFRYGQPITVAQLDRPTAEDRRWVDLHARLRSVMTPTEFAEAARTTQYGHYTSKAVVQSMWRAMERLGFKGGAVLEPGAGIGVFPGLMPDGIAANSSYTGIEYDTFTGNVLKQLMPDERILIDGYQDVKLPKNFYDVAIGNPPFSSSAVLSDPEYRKHAFKLHDYFFAKTIDRVKPGGLVMFVTSRYTMDKLDDKARAYLAERADLVGAIRMPQTAFKQNAGTEVVTDVLFLRKKVPGEVFEHGQAWSKSVPMTVGGHSYPVNEYFHAHPEMVLGEHSSQGSMRTAEEYTVKPTGEIEAQFEAAIANLPANVYHAAVGTAAHAAKVRELDLNPTVQKEGNFYVTEAGALMQREEGVGTRVDGLTPKQEALVKDYIPLRDALKQAQYDQLNNGPWEQSLATLKKAYDAFVAKNGRLLQFTTRKVSVTEVDPETGEKVKVQEERRAFPLQKLLATDPDSSLVMALESLNDETGEIKEAEALTKRVLDMPTRPKIETAFDALLTTLNDVGHVDMDMIAQRLGMSPAEAADALGSSVYLNPSAGWEMADEYLSGNVKRKLQLAREAARSDQRYARNVAALEAVQPAPKTPNQISVGLGMSWVPTGLYEQFLREVTGVTAAVSYNSATRQWSVSSKSGYATPRATADWGTNDRHAGDLLETALTGRPLKITRTDPATKATRTDDVATEAANAKLKQLKERFEAWVWEDAQRTDQLVQLYNDKFNTTIPRQFDGRHLQLPGTSKLFTVYDHVKRGAWRIIQSGNTYLAHAVGSGKTFQMVIAAMEQRRLGLVKKPMFVVPNHMLQQFASEWMQLYPAARLMIADEENFHGDNRRRFASRVALSDLDGVIITQSAFSKLDVSPAFKEKIINEQLDQLRAALYDVDPEAVLDSKGKSRDPKVKQIQRQIERMEEKLKAALSGAGKDTNVLFDEMGVDQLFVDEAHGYRKLDYSTARQIKGIQPAGSGMALDLYTKVRLLEERNPGRSLVMASGTPITNTLAELYTVQRFMDQKALEERGLDDFDSWASQYGREKSDLEPNAAGNYEPVSRFTEFVNVGDLTMAFRQFADVLTSDDLAEILGDKRPKVKGGGRRLVLTPKTEGYRRVQEELRTRMEASRAWRPSREEPNNPDPVIKIIGDGRLAAIDHRFMFPDAENDPTSKLNVAADTIIEKLRETADTVYLDKRTGKPEPVKGGTVMLFSDIGFGAGVSASRGFNARQWFEKRLRDAGVDMAQVAFMSDVKDSRAKLKLFRDVNQGRVRLLVGTSKNMGTGVNAQQRLTAVYHLDPTWYPADIEQREGRAVRQGNKNPEVELVAFATKGSYDENMWKMIARKADFINQVMTGDGSVDRVEDVSAASDYDVMAAMVAENPKVLELAGAEADVKRLDRLYRSHEDSRRTFRARYEEAESNLRLLNKLLPKAEQAAANVPDLSGDNFTAKAGRQTYTDRTKWAEALAAELKELSGRVTLEQTKVGEIGGYAVVFEGATAKVGGADMFNAWLRLDTPTPVTLMSTPADAPMGVAMRAQNAVSAIARAPARMREEIEQAKAAMDSVKSRLTAPFPMAQMLADARANVARITAELATEAAAATAAPAADAEPKLSRAAGRTGPGVSLSDVRSMADRAAAALPGLPPVQVLQSTAQAPAALREYLERQGAMGDTEGAFHDGALYLFADNLADMARAEHVLLTHELTHAGLRALLGERTAQAMRAIANTNGKVRLQAEETARRLSLPLETAIEEVLADMPAADLPRLKGWRGLVERAQQWLQNAGFTALSGRLRGWLDGRLTEQQRADAMVAELVTAARATATGRRPQLTRMQSASADMARQAAWLERRARAAGFESLDDMAMRDFDRMEALAARWRSGNPVGAMLSRGAAPAATGQATPPAQPLTPQQRADEIIRASVNTRRPLEAIAQAITRYTGIERATRAVGAAAGRALDRFTPEAVKAGIVADYGLPEAAIDQRTLMQGRKLAELRRSGELLDKLAAMTDTESRLAYEWMTSTDPVAIIRGISALPAEQVEVLQEIQAMVDRMSRDAVDLGLLSEATYQRNKGAYLHRSYQKHVLAEQEAKEAGAGKRRGGATAVLGANLRRRGIDQTARMEQIRQTAPEWWDVARKAGKADPDLIGRKVLRMERRAPTGAGTQPLPGMQTRGPGRVLEVHYLPADRAIPKQYRDWHNAGEWEIRDVSGDVLDLWRDYTPEERERMGEVKDVRYAVLTTIQGMVADVETARYLRWISRTYAKPAGSTVPGTVVQASEGYLRPFKPDEWVLVPDGNAPGTKAKRYGELAGKYVPGPIWNDIRHLTRGGRLIEGAVGEGWDTVLRLWKISKTALSPTVHVNNIMSNFVMADWADVSMTHVAKAMGIIMGAHGLDGEGAIGGAGNVIARATGIADREAARAIVNRYKDSGGELGGWVVNETMKDQLQPALERMQAALAANPGSVGAQVGVAASLQHLLHGRLGDAGRAAIASKPVSLVSREAKNMIDLYGNEDSVFRLAAWLKAKEDGATDIEAGKVSRRAFMDYNINAPWVQLAKNTALPFISFTYRGLPMLAEIMAKKPHKILKLMAVAGALNYLGLLMAGGADDDEVRRLLPSEKAGGLWGMVPKLIRMPWNDKNDSPVYLDIRRWIPLGDVVDVGQGHAALPVPPSLMPGGPLAIMGELWANKSAFTGKPITLETDTAAERAVKVIDHTYKAFAPNIAGLPGSYATTSIVNAAKGKTDAFGREQSVPMAVASSFGVKLGAYPADVLRRNTMLEAKAQGAEIDSGIRAIKRQVLTRGITPEEGAEKMRAQLEKKDRVMRKAQEKLGGEAR